MFVSSKQGTKQMFAAIRNNEVRKFDTEAEAKRFHHRMADQLSQLWTVVKIVDGKAVRI